MALVLFCSLRPNEREQKRNESRIDLVSHARHACMQVTVHLRPPATGHRMIRTHPSCNDSAKHQSIRLCGLFSYPTSVIARVSWPRRRRLAFDVQGLKRRETWGSSDSSVLRQEERFGFSPFPKEVSPRPRYPINQHLSCDHPSRHPVHHPSIERKATDRVILFCCSTTVPDTSTTTATGSIEGRRDDLKLVSRSRDKDSRWTDHDNFSPDREDT